MNWEVVYTDDAKKDFQKLDNSVRGQILSGIRKVKQNPLPNDEGGYGKPLRGKLSGCCKIVFKEIGKRVVYKLDRIGGAMVIIIISARADGEAYTEAEKRIGKYGL